MTAVAVWEHAPSADELLDARLTRGWAPTRTPTVDGSLILGHAACLTDILDADELASEAHRVERFGM